jgi:hypothetical protein
VHTGVRRCGLFNHIVLPHKPTHFLPRGSQTIPSAVPPKQDIPTAKNGLFSAASSRELYGESCTNAIWYPPGGFMDWHTNSNNPGKRLYVSWSETGEGGMKWLNENNIIVDDPDKPGWNVRIFDTPQWHMVYTDCWRFSIGWKV